MENEIGKIIEQNLENEDNEEGRKTNDEGWEDVEGTDANGEDTRTILEEYKLWRKNCTYMYSYVSETALIWPSLSVDFVKSNTYENKTKDDKFGVVRNLLLTTFTSGEDEEYVKIASLKLPRLLTDDKDMTREELQTVDSRLKISKKFKTDVEINKVRACPSDNHIFAMIDGNGKVYIYKLDSKMQVEFTKELVHHKENGFGICWNPTNSNQLATCSEDGDAVIWDIEQGKPISIFRDHNGLFVNDVRFSIDGERLVTVGEDKRIIVRDLVEGKIINFAEAPCTLNTATFSPFTKNLLAVGGENGNVFIYDTGNMKLLHTLVGHTKSVTNVEWDPFHHNIIGSCSIDRRVILWDLEKIGEEQTAEESEDGVPELLMMHGGHTGGVNDFSFSKEIPWCVASCSDDNVVHVWGVHPHIIKEPVITVSDSVLE
ncbi:hypothetical protein CANINC_002041 [Pichia inconspicua]|uniref:Histone-binding protein RBBP4-like N-terminal domain-containing protein n=1 Tax=Pichia inconspicua TaxID=52247 RepID=A0A4T0X2J3_9ASCO|nr:hypothetical protein CANINC_002041 [[Candida] inconspicua]